MRIIIELDAGATTPELQITTQGKNQSQPAASTTESGMNTTDAGAPKFMTSDQSSQEVSNLPSGSHTENTDNAASAGSAPGMESFE